MPNNEELVRINFGGAWVEVYLTAEDIRDSVYYQGFITGKTKSEFDPKNKEELLEQIARDVINEKLHANDEHGGAAVDINFEGPPTIDRDTINWEGLSHPAEESNLDSELWANPHDPMERPPKEALSAKQAATGNPAQQMAREALKIAKELSNLLNSLAQLQNREEVATVAGLQELPTAIDRLYELADKYRAGQVTDLQQPQQAMASYNGWDPDRLRRKAADPFVDTKQSPMRPARDPAEEFRFPREQTSSPHAADVPMEATADSETDLPLEDSKPSELSQFLGHKPSGEGECGNCGREVYLSPVVIRDSDGQEQHQLFCTKCCDGAKMVGTFVGIDTGELLF